MHDTRRDSRLAQACAAFQTIDRPSLGTTQAGSTDDTADKLYCLSAGDVYDQER